MLRFQASWLMETIMDNVTDHSSNLKWYFPCLWKFTTLEWLNHHNTTVTINVPIHSQAIIFKSWFTNKKSFLDDEMMKAFNQKLNKTEDISSNPFKDWLDIYFSKEQLSYLQYWREAIGDIREQSLKECFLAIVYHIINYWFSNNKYKMENVLSPDEVFTFYYQKYGNFREHLAKFNITQEKMDTLQAKECTNVVFNIGFSDEDYSEETPLLIYSAWIDGYTDLNDTNRSLKEKLKPFAIELGNSNNFDFYKRMTEKAQTASFCWSGTGIPLSLFKKKLVKPLQTLLEDRYKHNKLVYKPINPSKKSYDFILLFY